MKENIKEDIKTVEYNMKCIRNVMNNFEDELCENMQTKTDEVSKIIDNILSDYKRVLKENEELKNDYENLNNSVVVKNHCIKNSIPVQKVKNKIEELKQQNIFTTIDFIKTTPQDIKNTVIQELQELLEGRK